jgi:CO/xanthine dehydrogenase FAD-binding subunit
VAAVARRDSNGALLLAFSGVASVPVLMDDLETLAPPSDFRGSSEYRKAMAKSLDARVREALR